MAQAAVKIKIMPDSPDANLDEIETQAKEIIEKFKGKIARIEREPIAFGLNAIIFLFGIDETFEQDPLTDSLSKVPHVSSAEIIDFRRAFG